MTDRRRLIRNVLSDMQDADTEGVTIADCGTVSQINVFSGASININVTTIDKSKPRIVNYINEETMLDDSERERFYRMCHGIAKDYGIYEEMRRHMRLVWQAKSMRDLTDTALKELLQYMRKLEAEKRRTA